MVLGKRPVRRELSKLATTMPGPERSKPKEKSLSLKAGAAGFASRLFFNRLSCTRIDEGDWVIRVGLVVGGKLFASAAFVITSGVAASNKKEFLSYLARLEDVKDIDVQPWPEPESFTTVPAPEVIKMARFNNQGEILLYDFGVGMALAATDEDESAPINIDGVLHLKGSIALQKHLLTSIYEG